MRPLHVHVGHQTRLRQGPQAASHLCLCPPRGPPDVAEYLVNIDRGGKTVVRTPHAQDTYWEGEYDSLEALCFLAQLGAGQGTVDAPLNWNAVFDILLDALATVPSDYRFHDIDCLQHSTVDTAAADDLLSACGTLQALQHKADIVSAFCIIFGLDIATTKLRTELVPIIATNLLHQTPMEFVSQAMLTTAKCLQPWQQSHFQSNLSLK